MLRALFLTVGLFAASIQTAEACSCVFPDTIYSYNNHDRAVIAKAIGVQPMGNWVAYQFRIIKDLKTCAAAGDVVRVWTSASGASCGTHFTVGQSYLLFASEVMVGGQTHLQTTLCSGNKLVSQITADDRDFLSHRPLFCGGTASCVDGTTPYSCFVDPCTVTPACPGSTCAANYCGGCTAEFYDASGYGMCMPW